MKRIVAIVAALLLVLTLAACGGGDVPAGSPPQSGIAKDEDATSLWTGSYSGDGVEIVLFENDDGTVDATIEEQAHHSTTLTVSGNTATGEELFTPETQGGDITLDEARDKFPNIIYNYTITTDNGRLTYHRTMTLSYMDGDVPENQRRPEQVEEFTATLSRNSESVK